LTATSFQATKRLRVTFTLGTAGAFFPNTEDNTLQLTDMRIVAQVESVVRFATQLDLNIYGMHQQDMNQLTVLFFGQQPTRQLNNTVLLEANGGDGWNQVFFGTIINGSPDYRNLPDVPFHVQARFGYFAGAAVTTPLSYPQGATVAQAVQTIANAMNLQFQNNGVTATLSPGSYIPGSPWDQLKSVCSGADIDFYTEGNVLAIAPKGAPRTQPQTITVTPSNGLMGYPRIEVAGIGFDCLYTPAIANGALVALADTDVPAANGTWLPYSASHMLESWKPGGRWQSSLHCIWPPS
jgi:Baseplate hub gp41